MFLRFLDYGNSLVFKNGYRIFFIAEMAIIEIPKHAKETQVISKPINFALYVENNFIYYTSKEFT